MQDVESGSKTDRRGLDTLIKLVQGGQVSSVTITRIDRISRSLVHLRKLIDIFQAANVPLIALDDAIDYRTPTGRFHLNMIGAMAEMEVDRLSERVRHGWNHLRNRGVAMNPPFGFCKVNDRHELDFVPFVCLLEDHSERSRAQIGRELVEAFLESKSLRGCLKIIYERYGIKTFAHHREKGGRVAREMFRFSPGGLRLWLSNPVLRGHVQYLRRSENPVIKYDRHPGLMSEAEYQEILKILNFNKQHRGYGSTKLKYPLSGLVQCGECRSSCYSATGSTNWHRAKKTGEPLVRLVYYQCKNWRHRACTQKTMIQEQVIEAAVIEKLTTVAETIADQVLQPLEPEEPLELRELRNQILTLKMLPRNPAIDRAIEDIAGQITVMERSLILETSGREDRVNLLEVFRDPDYWATLEPSEKQEIYRELVQTIVIKDGQIQEINLKI